MKKESFLPSMIFSIKHHADHICQTTKRTKALESTIKVSIRQVLEVMRCFSGPSQTHKFTEINAVRNDGCVCVIYAVLQVIGNKMTSLNLATIFGPNLLHKQKSSEKEFSVESSARMEDSAAIISVVQLMIDTHQSLFTVHHTHMTL